MKNKGYGHWWGVVLAAVVVAGSARAQYGYSNISITSGTVYGSSVTELPYYDSLNGIWAVVDAYLYNPSGTQVGYQEGWDDGVGYAEADVSASGSSVGTYQVFGEHWDWDEYIEGYQYIGESSASVYSYGPVECDFPLGETSYADESSFTPQTRFTVTLLYNSFIGRTGQERWTGGDTYSTCGDGNSLVTQMSTPPFSVNSSNGYIDTIGYPAGSVAAFRANVTLPCGFTIYQTMNMTCPGGPSQDWITNEVQLSIGATTVTIYRGGFGGTYSY